MSSAESGRLVPRAQFPLPENSIATRVAELGRHIGGDFPPSEPLMLVGVLRASFMFIADLARAIDRPLEIEFVSARSYVADKTTGTVRIDGDTASQVDVSGKHVVLVDTMLDHGHTMTAVAALFEKRDLRSLSTCVLLRKPHSPHNIVSREFVGFDVPNQYVIGYGLDSNGGHRNQRFISAVE